MRKTPEAAGAEESSRRGGIQSIEVGAPLLRALVDAGGATSLTALAARAGMPVSKAHKYLASFVRVGLMAQSPGALYMLGPLARELGLAALRRNDVIDFAQDFLDALNAELGLTASMAVWSEHGPVVVRKTENRHRISLVVPLGTALPLLSSSNGRVFASYAEPSLIQPLVRKELAANARDKAGRRIATAAELARVVDHVRASGVAVTESVLTPGVSAMSAPVFDQTGKLAASLTVLGFAGELDLAQEGRPFRALKDAAGRLSRLLGGTAASRPGVDATRRPNGRD